MFSKIYKFLFEKFEPIDTITIAFSGTTEESPLALQYHCTFYVGNMGSRKITTEYDKTDRLVKFNKLENHPYYVLNCLNFLKGTGVYPLSMSKEDLKIIVQNLATHEREFYMVGYKEHMDTMKSKKIKQIPPKQEGNVIPLFPDKKD
jgi:hypothetical protein